MARSTLAQHPIAEDDQGNQKPVHLDATEARSGSRDRDVFVVLMISTALAVIVLLGALAYYSGGMGGFGNQSRSTSTFEQPNQPAPAAAKPTPSVADTTLP
jgi:hypothetical protein